MKTITKFDETVKNIIGKQKIENVKYRWMKYVITTQYKENLLAYNSITAELIVLESSEKNILNERNLENNDVFSYLVSEFFFVPVDFNDVSFYQNIFTTKRLLLRKKGIDFYKILTTNDCNARCFYCYKLTTKHISMTEETTKKLSKYIIKNHSKKVHLYWFGGEPLMNVYPINYICNDLRNNSIPYKSSIITNGYLFNDELVKKAITDWNLEFVQITLDGTENVHNRTKAFIYGKEINAYSIIVDNIERLLKTGIRVLVRLNMDLYNSEDLYKLVKELKMRFSIYENFKIYSALLFEENSNRKVKREFEMRKGLVDKYLEFCDYLKKEQVIEYKLLPTKMKINCCMADSDGSVVVLPDGRIAKCDLDAEGSVCGHISSNVQDSNVIESWKVLREQDQNCFNCSMRPLCIELKGCKETTLTCDELEKKMKLYSYKNSMINIYRNSIEQ